MAAINAAAVAILELTVIVLTSNNSKKTAMHSRWEVWMTDGGGIIDGIAKEPSRKQVAEWLVDAYMNIPEEIARNAWLKTDYTWF